MFSFFDPAHLQTTLQLIGYLGIASIVFAESGLFFGFFLPGDSLLLTAGVLAGTGFFNFPLLVLVIVAAAILGDSVGYWFGFFAGKKLYAKKSSRLFKQEHLVQAELFYEKYGPKALVLARFVPVVRTFVPIVAGAASMKYKVFALYNVLGGILWGFGVTFLGYVLGTRIPNIDHYLLPIILVIIFLSFLPLVFEVVMARKRKH